MTNSTTCNYCTKLLTAKDNCIFCELCNHWMHSRCVKISLTYLKQLSKSLCPYYCPKCISLELSFASINKKQFDSIFSENKNLVFNLESSCQKYRALSICSFVSLLNLSLHMFTTGGGGKIILKNLTLHKI